METPEQKQPKAVNTYKQRGWPDVVAHLGALIISKNLLLPAGVLAFVLLTVWKLNSGDLRLLLEQIINRRWFAVGGWVVSLVIVFVSIKIVRWQSRTFRERIDEIRNLKQSPLQGQLRLEDPKQIKDVPNK